MRRKLQSGHLQGCISTLFIFLTLLAFGSSLSADAQSPVRVGLISIGSPQAITLRCDKPFDIISSGTSEPVSTVTAQEVILAAGTGGVDVTVNGSLAGTYPAPLRLAPKEDGAVFEIVSPKVKYTRYRGVLEIGGKSGLSIINELPLDDYVRGVIPAEIPQSFHPEAQKALTVAIRTYVLTSMGRHKTDGYNVCNTVNCQGFSGASRDAEWVDKAVEATKGQVITYQNELISAVYSSDCGGATQSNEDGGFASTPWPYLRTVSDSPADYPVKEEQKAVDAPPPSDASIAVDTQTGTLISVNADAEFEPVKPDFCAGSPNHAWSKSYTADELARKFEGLKSAKIGKFQSMEFAEYDPSGRVKTILVKGDAGEYRTTGNKFRDLFGQNVIKSTRMNLTTAEDGKYTITGQGYGHGVGLCQYGANGLARANLGATYMDILKHYYTGVEIKSLSEIGSRTAD